MREENRDSREELTHLPAGSGKKAVEPLSEKECNVILSRIAGELGLSDASKLPYASQITRQH